MYKLIIFTVLIILNFSTQGFASDYNEKMLEKINLSNGREDGFSFAVMGDNRDGDHVLTKIIKHINKDPDIEFAINNGDIVPDGYKKEFKRYKVLIENSHKPFLNLIGNHEIPWYMSKGNYTQYFGKLYFSFSKKETYFIFLDDSDESQIGAAQEKWLVDELKKSQTRANRFVFMHVPLYDPREGKYQKGHSLDNIGYAKKLNNIFDQYNVTMLFTSHIHFYYRGQWQRTPFIISGGAGAPLKHYKTAGFYHYIKVIVNDKKISYQVIKIDAKPLGFFDALVQDIRNGLNLD